MSRGRAFHWTGVVLLALVVSAAFLRFPGLGDDFTYWRFAFNVHDLGTDAYTSNSFHQMRWPVWGLCWMLQGIFGRGLIAYWGVPMLYLTAGALLAFEIARRLFRSTPAGWMAAIAFVFHPLLDSVVYRPMPDLSEGIWAACIILAWQATMRAEKIGPGIAFAALTGLFFQLAQANRFTGVLMIPVVALLTLFFYPRRFHWFALSIVFGGVFYWIEALVYKQITGDFLASLHANMGARGKKGTDPVPLWYLPFRFLDTLWKAGRLSPLYCILGVVGAVVTWRNFGKPGRIVVAWFGLHLLGYSCALQSISPPRPMLRDAERFLGALAIPMAILIAGGLPLVWNALGALRWNAVGKIAQWPRRWPVVTGVTAVVLLALVSSRSFFDLGFVPAYRKYLLSRPAGTRVLTDERTKAISHLVGSAAAEKLQWFVASSIIGRTDALEEKATQADEFWYTRKLVWLRPRQDIRYHALTEARDLASYFAAPEKNWRLVEALNISNTPEFVFYQRRRPDDPPPLIMTAADLGTAGVLPTLPAAWNGKERRLEKTFTIPEPLRGKLVRIQTQAQSDFDQPVLVLCSLYRGDKLIRELETKPQMYPETSADFFAFRVPADADRCFLALVFSKSAKTVRLNDLTIYAE